MTVRDTVAVLADLHLEPDRSRALFAALDDALGAIEDHDPDLIVVLGDVVQETDAETDARLLGRLVDRLDATGADWRCVPGNHDVARLSPAQFEDVVGHPTWGVDEDRARWFLDSAAPRLEGPRGELDDAQLRALEDRPPTDDAVVFVHHPVHYRSLRGHRWFESHPEEAFCGNKRAVTERLDPDATAAVLNGHLHDWSVTEYAGVTHFTVEAFNRSATPDAETGAYAVLERGDGLRVTHYGGDGTEHEVRLPA